MRLFLVRHGQTSWNAGGRAQGHSDVELDDTGLQQSERLAQRLSTLGIRRIFSSDLKRCTQTAQALSRLTGQALELREDLRERTFGVLEGAHFTELRAWFSGESRAQGLSEFEVRPDGGESVKDVWKRLGKFERLLERSVENTVVFTHGGTCSIILAKLIRANLDTTKSLRFENASLTELIRRPDGFWQLLSYNNTTHLEGLNEKKSG